MIINAAKTCITVFSLLILLFPDAVFGQYTRLIRPFDVTVDAQPLEFPFLGGFNDPKPTFLDIDGDGLIDLFIGQPSGKLVYFKNTGTTISPEWTIQTGRFAGADIGSWHTFADIDNDNDFDLFCDSRLGQVLFYRNDNGVFTIQDSTFGDFFTGSNNTPTFVDIDADSDLDFFFGDPSGLLTFYPNEGTPEVPSFGAEIGTYDSILAFPGGGSPPYGSASQPNHGFSSIRFVDIDFDNDYDLYWGDLFNNYMYEFLNLGTAEISDLTWSTEFFLPDQTLGFNHPSFGDIDSDNDLDLLVGVANSASKNNLLFYRNTGDSSAVVLSKESDNWLTNVDLGSYAMPTSGDIDGDGDIDLLVGNQSGPLILIENTGSKLKPKFEWHNEGGFAGINVGISTAPLLVDWDGDKDLDLLVGKRDGTIGYWRNDGNSQTFVPTLVSSQFGGIKVDQLAVPAVADFNNDGNLELVVGEWDFNNRANLILYENLGTPDVPNFVIRRSKLIFESNERAFTIPSLYDYDHDGLIDLILGSRSVGLTYYRNTAPIGTFPDSLHLQALPDTLPGTDDGTRLSFIPIDIDADAYDDVIVGEEDGGLNFYRNDSSCCQGMRGDVFPDGSNGADIIDLTVLIDHLFITFRELPCPAAGNIDNDEAGLIDITDLTVMIDHLFITFVPLADCMVLGES